MFDKGTSEGPKPRPHSPQAAKEGGGLGKKQKITLSGIKNSI